MSTHFGAAVRARRKALKWTQKALAARVGCTDAYISEIENRRKEPGDELRARLIEVLDLRNLPEEASALHNVISMSHAQGRVDARETHDDLLSPPNLVLVEEGAPPGPPLNLTQVLGQALTKASLIGWSPQGHPGVLTSAQTLEAGSPHGLLLAQGTLAPSPHDPTSTPRRILIKAPRRAPSGELQTGLLEREFYLRQTLPDVPGFGPPPLMATLPRALFPQTSWAPLGLPENITVLLFSLSQRHTALRPPQTLERVDLMSQGVRSVRDLANWCAIAHSLTAAVLNLHSAGWAHRGLCPAHILLRTERGFHHDVRIIEFGTATPLNRPCPAFVDAPTLWHWHPARLAAWSRHLQHHDATQSAHLNTSAQAPFDPAKRPWQWTPRPRVEDIHALGAILGHLLVGSADHSPGPTHAEQPTWQVYNAQQRSDDLRFHIDEGRKHPERLPSNLRAELPQLYTLCHQLMENAEHVDLEDLTQALETLEHARARAQLIMTDWPGSPRHHTNLPHTHRLAPGYTTATQAQSRRAAFNDATAPSPYTAPSAQRARQTTHERRREDFHLQFDPAHFDRAGFTGPRDDRRHNTLASPAVPMSPKPHRGDAAATLETLLRSMETHASQDEEQRWCARYITNDVATIKAHIGGFPWLTRTLQRLDTPCPPDALNFDQAWVDCLEFLRLGYVRYATEILTGLLRLGPTDNPTRDIQMLRVAVGGLLMREGCLEPVREILTRFDEDSHAENRFIGHLGHRRWWIELLRGRLALLDGRQDLLSGLMERLPTPDPELNPRAWLWRRLLTAMVSLERGVTPPGTAETLALARRWTTSTPESLLLAQLLGQSRAAQGALAPALQSLHSGMGEAAARGFPVEYALMLCQAASLTRDALGDDAQRRQLHSLGVHTGAVLEVAGRLALRAADMFTAMNLEQHLQQALVVAGDCNRLRGSMRDLMRAVTWYSLARNNTALSEPVIRTPAMLTQLQRLEGRLIELEARWRQDPALPTDPDAAQVGAVMDHQGELLLALHGNERLSLEMPDANHPHLGTILGHLVDAHVPEPPENILDLGCGVGADTVALARHFKDARVMGVDVSPWCVRAARRRRPQGSLAERCVFHHMDLTAFLNGRLRLGQPDLVIARDALRHMTFKKTFLQALRANMEPGAVLICMEPIQRQRCGPRQWVKTLEAAHLSHLETQASLYALLDAAGFESLTRRPVDWSPDYAQWLRERLEWFRDAHDRDARRLAERPHARDIALRTFPPLIEAFGPNGALGWIGIAAKVRAS